MARQKAVIFLIAVALGLALTPRSAAQTDSLLLTIPDQWQPHVFYGGSIYLSFGNGTSIGASPLIGWQFTPRFGAGVGITYIYYNNDDYTSHIYGGRVMARYDIIPQLYGKAEFAYLVYNDSFKDIDLGSTSVPYLFLGGGYRQRVSATTYLELEVMFDVLQDPNSQYDAWEPVFAVGVSVGV